MDEADELELREAMKSVRGGTRAWLLCAVSVALGVGGIVHLRGRLAEAVDQAATADAKVAERQALLSSLEQVRGDLEKRVAGLEAAKNELEQLKGREAAGAKAAEDQKSKEQALEAALGEKLKPEIDAHKVAVHNGPGGLSVAIVETALFAVDGVVLGPEGPAILEKVGAVLGVAKDREIEVGVHHDNGKIPDKLKLMFPNPWVLSAHRAGEVARYLQEKTPVNGKLLHATGFGALHPINANNTPEHRVQNRRIEIRLLPAHP